jgi:ribosome-interacting GTPase 1
MCRVYTKKQGNTPDFDEPVVLTADRGGTTVMNFCNHVHRSLHKEIKYALV